MGLLEEINEQPQVLQGLIDNRRSQIRQVAKAIQGRRIDYVFLAARGTSDHAGVYAQYLLGARNGYPVALAAPSLFTLYAEPPRLKNALVLGISQSGQSPDIVQVLAEGRRQGALTLALTNDTASPIAQTTDLVLELGAGEERAVAATKTYTAELMTLALLSAALDNEFQLRMDELSRIPPAIQSVLERSGAIEELAVHFKDIKGCIVLGRGYNYSTALEWALKLKELVYILAYPYSPADIQHGPMALLEPGFPVLAIAPTDATQAESLVLLRSMTRDHAVDLLVLSDQEEALALAQSSFALPTGLVDWTTPILAIVPAQVFCYYLARVKGFDTEKPRNIQKVSLTY